jgi:hypothetical protein
MKKPSVYIAGPMRRYPLWNFPEFDRVRDIFAAAGFEVFSPADNDRALGFNPEDQDPQGNVAGIDPWDFLGWDLARVNDADVIYFLKGWKESAGALLERQVAECLMGMGEVKYLVEETDDTFTDVVKLVVMLKRLGPQAVEVN